MLQIFFLNVLTFGGNSELLGTGSLVLPSFAPVTKKMDIEYLWKQWRGYITSNIKLFNEWKLHLLVYLLYKPPISLVLMPFYYQSWFEMLWDDLYFRQYSLILETKLSRRVSYMNKDKTTKNHYTSGR